MDKQASNRFDADQPARRRVGSWQGQTLNSRPCRQKPVLSASALKQMQPTFQTNAEQNADVCTLNMLPSAN
jgi:hypothetical protein